MSNSTRHSRSITPTETREAPTRACNKNKPPPTDPHKKRKKPSPKHHTPESVDRKQVSPSTTQFLAQYKFTENELEVITEDTVNHIQAGMTSKQKANEQSQTAKKGPRDGQNPSTTSKENGDEQSQSDKAVLNNDQSTNGDNSEQQEQNASKSYADAAEPPEQTTFLRGAPQHPKGPRDNRKAVKRPVDERDRDLRIMALEFNQDQTQISANKTDAETQKNKLRVSPSPFTELQSNETLRAWWWNDFAKHLVCPEGIDPNPPGLIIRQINLATTQSNESGNGGGRGRGTGRGRGRGRGGRGGGSGQGRPPPALVLLLIFPCEIFVVWVLEQYWGELDAGIRQLAEFHRRYKSAAKNKTSLTDFSNGFMISTAFNIRPNLTARQTLQNNWIRDVIRETNAAIKKRETDKTVGDKWMDANRYGTPQIQQTYNGSDIKIRQQTGTRGAQNFPSYFSKVVKYDDVHLDPRFMPYIPKRKKPTNVSGAVRDYMRPQDFTEAALRENDYAREIDSPLRRAEPQQAPKEPYEQLVTDDDDNV